MVANRRLVAVLGQIACPAGVSFQGTAGDLKLNLERPGYDPWFGGSHRTAVPKSFSDRFLWPGLRFFV